MISLLPGGRSADEQRRTQNPHLNFQHPGLDALPVYTEDDVLVAKAELQKWRQQEKFHSAINGANTATLHSKAQAYKSGQENKVKQAKIIVGQVREADTKLQEELFALQPKHEEQNQRVMLAQHKAGVKAKNISNRYADLMRSVV